MKKLINDPRNVVREMLEGLTDLSPGLALMDGENVVLRAGLPPAPDRKVAVISGGGSGHEPAHAGFVGPGLLSAAVCGDVFTSPSVDAVLAAIQATAGPAGAVLIVKNYTGDRLNFALAAELAQAEGIPVEIVVVADDVSLRDVVPPERRRGIAGTVLVHKVAGAAAEAGAPVQEVAHLARRAASRLGTMGVGLGACTVPAAGRPGFELAENEIELGLGIHGEKGVERSHMRTADSLVETILTSVSRDLDLAAGQHVALLVNGLGGTPAMELSIVARHALGWLRQRGIEVNRAWCGNLMTALEMPGCSLSVLVLDDTLLDLLDRAAAAPGWPGSGRIPAVRAHLPRSAPPEASVRGEAGPLAGAARRVALAIAEALEQAEAELTRLDAHAGDGDLGASMARGAAALRQLPDQAWATPAAALHATGHAFRRAIAGSSGPFYATALLRASRALGDHPRPHADAWGDAFRMAVASISEIGGAQAGDRTMVDALAPALDAWVAARNSGQSGVMAWREAAVAAQEGADRTADMHPRVGRAAYLGERVLGVPDGGAMAVAIWMAAIADAIEAEDPA
jgi:dihydroxyacetone kinase